MASNYLLNPEDFALVITPFEEEDGHIYTSIGMAGRFDDDELHSDKVRANMYELMLSLSTAFTLLNSDEEFFKRVEREKAKLFPHDENGEFEPYVDPYIKKNSFVREFLGEEDEPTLAVDHVDNNVVFLKNLKPMQEKK